MYAVQEDNFTTCQILVDRSADIMMENRAGHTALTIANDIDARRSVRDVLIEVPRGLIAVFTIRHVRRDDIDAPRVCPVVPHLHRYAEGYDLPDASTALGPHRHSTTI